MADCEILHRCYWVTVKANVNLIRRRPYERLNWSVADDWRIDVYVLGAHLSVRGHAEMNWPMSDPYLLKLKGLRWNSVLVLPVPLKLQFVALEPGHDQGYIRLDRCADDGQAGAVDGDGNNYGPDGTPGSRKIPVDAHTEAVEVRGRAADGHVDVADHGVAVDAHDGNVGAHDGGVAAHGGAVDGHGGAVDGHGGVASARGEVVNAHGEVENDCGEVVDAQGEVVDAQGEVVDAQGEAVYARDEAVAPHQYTVGFPESMCKTNIKNCLAETCLVPQ
ncbi:hypothetical protein BGX26_012796 [Mortierella sp. AD094]|nr:hypothetical protein BGX26_012796 [Mortierella sp. AD094]